MRVRIVYKPNSSGSFYWHIEVKRWWFPFWRFFALEWQEGAAEHKARHLAHPIIREIK